MSSGDVVWVPQPDDLHELVRKVRSVPDAFRSFEEPESYLAQGAEAAVPLLTQLLDAGLPHRGVGSGRRYDRIDLDNVSLALRLPSPRWTAMQWWSKELNSGREGPLTHAVRISGSCPDQGHSGQCTYQLDDAVVSASLPGTVRQDRPGVFAVTARTDVRVAHFRRAEHVELVHRFAPLEFFVLPWDLPFDRGFVEQTGLADCRLASHIGMVWAEELGIGSRPASGLCMSAPFPLRHMWIDLRVGEDWAAFDPHLLGALAAWGIVARETWPPHRSPEGHYWRLGQTLDIEVPYMHHRGRGIPSSFLLRRAPQRA